MIYIHDKPVISLGGRGCFDEFGIHPTSVMEVGNEIYLYYTGWNRGYSIPYETYIGLAVSVDGGKSFERYSDGPVVGKTQFDPFLANGAYVYRESGMYYMFYASAAAWAEQENKPEPVYTLKKASSRDGKYWVPEDKNILPSRSKLECISRPSILKLGNTYHMWYAYRSIEDFRGGQNSYRIGYAHSDDLTNWQREDNKAGIQLSDEGWDSQMNSYPQVVAIHDKLLMFYNGNYFGKEGFGYAETQIKNI